MTLSTVEFILVVAGALGKPGILPYYGRSKLDGLVLHVSVRIPAHWLPHVSYAFRPIRRVSQRAHPLA